MCGPQEKLYDFEVNKRNNLLFYGVAEGKREGGGELLNKIRGILREQLQVISLTNKFVTQMVSGFCHFTKL